MTAPIRLRIPHERPFHGIARLVVGGLAARLHLSYEHLEDLQLALDSVLADGRAVGPDVTLELVVRAEGLDVVVGPLDGAELRAALERNGESIGLGRLLEAVAEDVAVETRPDGDWLKLAKSVRITPP
jgi:hypothetical protein